MEKPLSLKSRQLRRRYPSFCRASFCGMILKLKPTGYTTVPRALAQDNRLSLKARGFLCFIHSFPNGLRDDHVLKMLGISPRELSAIKNELLEFGYADASGEELSVFDVSRKEVE